MPRPPCYPPAMRVFVAANLILAGFSGWAEPELRAAQPSHGEKPGILARIAGGKTIHIKCMGTGSPTVILTAGLGDSEWQKVQPQVARVTKVCFWDRYGSGFSSKATGRETVAETTAHRSESFGLVAIRQRVEQLGGSFVLESAPGQGTAVAATFPIGESFQAGAALRAGEVSS